MARLKRATATSAGGIVIEIIGGAPHIVAGHRRREHSGTWTLPKGTPNLGEPLQDTAIREVGEETGLTVRIVAPLEAIEYWFVQGGLRVHKTVHYWLMEATGGDLAGHDHEFDDVRWVALEQAPRLLTFPTERALVERAAAVHAALAAERTRPNGAVAVVEGGRA